MNPFVARQLALQLLVHHGLNGWRFRFDNARRRFGCCDYRAKTISLSRPLTLLNGEGQVRDTLLHEIAHALTPGDGHGARWRAACRRVGATPKRCYGDLEVASPPRPPAAWRYGCPPCNWWVDRRRVVANRYVCRTCGGRLLYEHKATRESYTVEVGHGHSRLVPVHPSDAVAAVPDPSRPPRPLPDPAKVVQPAKVILPAEPAKQGHLAPGLLF